MFLRALRITAFTVLMTLFLGLGYPLLMTVVADVLFPHQAHGSLISENGQVVGSELVGQTFTDRRYFHSRPSHAWEGYSANDSSGGNLGMTSKTLSETYDERIQKIQRRDGNENIPADLIAASGSGLDPDISPESAYFQAERVAKARGQSLEKIHALIETHTQGRTLGILGAWRVNVFVLNRALDSAAP
jgi:K+-transporting ATPase ATPase C chain